MRGSSSGSPSWGARCSASPKGRRKPATPRDVRPRSVPVGAVRGQLLFGFPHGATGYVFGIAAALLLGMPLALAAGILMRPIRDQLLDVAAIAGAGLVSGALTLIFIVGGRWYTMWGMVLWTGACAAIGRLTVVRLVTTHDRSEHAEARRRMAG